MELKWFEGPAIIVSDTSLFTFTPSLSQLCRNCMRAVKKAPTTQIRKIQMNFYARGGEDGRGGGGVGDPKFLPSGA